MAVPLSRIHIQEKNSEETAIVMAHRTAHGCSLPVKSVRGREEVSLSIGVSLQLLRLPPDKGDRGPRGIVAPRSASFPVLAVLSVQPVDCLVQILRCYGQSILDTIKKNALSHRNFFIIVDNSRCYGYYQIKRFGVFQGAGAFEVKGSLRKGRAFCFTSNSYVTTPMGPLAEAIFSKTLPQRDNRLCFSAPCHSNATKGKRQEIYGIKYEFGEIVFSSCCLSVQG